MKCNDERLSLLYIYQSANRIYTHARHRPAYGLDQKKTERAIMSGVQISKHKLNKTSKICTLMAKSLASVDGQFSAKRRLGVRGLEESHESHLRSSIDHSSRQILFTLA